MVTDTLARAPAPVSEAVEKTGIFARIWWALEQAGMRRARRELEQIAAQYEHTRPELARQLRAAGRHGLEG